MKSLKYIVVILTITIWGCSHANQDTLIGKWSAKTPFSKAIYKIVKEGDVFNGEVVYYDDGTTLLEGSSAQGRYVFQNLKYKKGHYVDAVSSATSKDAPTSDIDIEVMHDDTIEVTTYIGKKPIKEIWTRIK